MPVSKFNPGDRVIITPKGDARPFPAEVVRDIGSTLIEVVTSTGRIFPARIQVALMQLDEQASPAVRREYVGVMGERLEKGR